jgi:hypothetical protein
MSNLFFLSFNIVALLFSNVLLGVVIDSYTLAVNTVKANLPFTVSVYAMQAAVSNPADDGADEKEVFPMPCEWSVLISFSACG